MLKLEGNWSMDKGNFGVPLVRICWLSETFFQGIVVEELKAANQQQAFGVAILILVLIISPVIIFLVSSECVFEGSLSEETNLFVFRFVMRQRPSRFSPAPCRKKPLS